MINTDVQSILKYLESNQFECTCIPQTAEAPFDQIFIPMGVDEHNRDMLLQIRLVPVDLSETDGQSFFNTDTKNLVNVQFYYFLAFQIQEECIPEIARTVAGLNRSCLLPGFEFSEADRMICYRSALLAGKKIDEAIFMTVLSSVISSVEIFSSILEEVGTGKKTFADLVNQTFVSD